MGNLAAEQIRYCTVFALQADETYRVLLRLIAAICTIKKRC